MDIYECNILKCIADELQTNQREIAKSTGYSLGKVNKSLKNLMDSGYLDENKQLTDKAKAELEEKSPCNAIILAAGYGVRMAPINTEIAKGLITVHGDVLIERMIEQLHTAGIEDIKVVVGFQKESFDYLIDKYGVELVVNMDYADKNNLHSLNKVKDYIGNTYIVPCDIWCEKNPFSQNEMYSWYMVKDNTDIESDVRINRSGELVRADEDTLGNGMVGISYILSTDAEKLIHNIEVLAANPRYDNTFWEEALYEKNKMFISAKIESSDSVYEINTYEQLRNADGNSETLQSDVLELIAKEFKCDVEDITDIRVMKKGMTNRSFMFNVNGKEFIMRIPGEGTEDMINRREEYDVYQAIKDIGICDDIYYINPENGYKITAYIENARGCNDRDFEQVKQCMQLVKEFHKRKLKVNHTFDLKERLNHYESLWSGPSCYKDYDETKKKVMELLDYVDKQPKDWILCHIDPTVGNFIFTDEKLYLIDWEYAGMQDPHVDVAMFAICSMYNREEVEKLIDIYFPEGCEKQVRLKLYAYIAICGLLWSNWCEYKRQCGVEFGEYSMKQYRYAKDYYKIWRELKEWTDRYENE